jgi:hypothetical protein
VNRDEDTSGRQTDTSPPQKTTNENVHRRDKTAASTKWFRKRVDQLLACPEVLSRLKAITALQDQRRCGLDVSRELITFACMAVSPHQGRPGFLDRYWARGTGKTWKALREFPDRLEKMADEVKCINQADPLFYARRRGNELSRFELLRLQEQCMQLPVTMRLFRLASATEQRTNMDALGPFRRDLGRARIGNRS